ncbi:MAG: helix-turn-helix transcriptional regulator [Pseudomonadota bacterium]
MLELTRTPPTDTVELSYFIPHSKLEKVRTFMHQEGIEEEKEYYTIEEVLPYTDEEMPSVYLRGLRYREDLTQKQLSEKTGIAIRHISEMENNKRPIGKKNAVKLAEVLGCNPRKLLSI